MGLTINCFHNILKVLSLYFIFPHESSRGIYFITLYDLEHVAMTAIQRTLEFAETVCLTEKMTHL